MRQAKLKEEAELEELRALRARATGEKYQKKLDWMYDGGAGAAEAEAMAVTMGKKEVELVEPSDGATAASAPAAATTLGAMVDSLNAQERGPGRPTNVDASSAGERFSIAHEDPMFAIQAKEKAAREAMLKDPAMVERMKRQLAAKVLAEHGHAERSHRASSSGSHRRRSDDRRRQHRSRSRERSRKHSSSRPRSRSRSAERSHARRHNSHRRERERRRGSPSPRARSPADSHSRRRRRRHYSRSPSHSPQHRRRGDGRSSERRAGSRSPAPGHRQREAAQRSAPTQRTGYGLHDAAGRSVDIAHGRPVGPAQADVTARAAARAAAATASAKARGVPMQHAGTPAARMSAADMAAAAAAASSARHGNVQAMQSAVQQLEQREQGSARGISAADVLRSAAAEDGNSRLASTRGMARARDRHA